MLPVKAGLSTSDICMAGKTSFVTGQVAGRGAGPYCCKWRLYGRLPPAPQPPSGPFRLPANHPPLAQTDNSSKNRNTETKFVCNNSLSSAIEIHMEILGEQVQIILLPNTANNTI